MEQRILLFSAAQEIPLQYTAHYPIYNRPLRVPNPSQIITPYVTAFFFFKIPYNAILYMINIKDSLLH